MNPASRLIQGRLVLLSKSQNSLSLHTGLSQVCGNKTTFAPHLTIIYLMNSFSSFSLREELTRAVTDMGFIQPTPIQQKVIPALLSQPSDIIALAQTGTGKTAAFGLPLLHHLDFDQRDVQALILSPTRELGMQIQEEMTKYGQYIPGFRSVAVYGGVSISGQIREIKARPQVIVATPGRLIDLLERKVLNLDQVKYLILDEADEMLNMGFREDIELILSITPQRQSTWLFSATMNADVRRIAKKFMEEWAEFSVAQANVTNENIEHRYFVTQHHHRFETLRRLLDINPGIYGIIFTRTRQDCQDISEKLMRLGYAVSPLHGDMDQKMRTRVMDRFKARALQAIVATDVAARGIDVQDITHVINYELPDDPEVYTHRSGRTARAGKSGICLSIVSPRQIQNLRQIERIVKSRFQKSEIPSGTEVVKKRIDHFLTMVSKAQPGDDFQAISQEFLQTALETMEPKELLQKLLWLHMQDTMDAYRHADDLNVTVHAPRSLTGGASRSVRLFINLGQKDGIRGPEDLIALIQEHTDLEPSMLQRISVKELSSYFNVNPSAAELILAALPSRKFKGRRIRVNEAESRSFDRPRPGGRPVSRKSGSYGYGGGKGSRSRH